MDRAVEAYVLHCVRGLSMRAAARELGMRHPSTVLRMVKRVEDLREPGTELDRVLTELEAQAALTTSSPAGSAPPFR